MTIKLNKNTFCKQREALEAALKDANDPHANGLQKTTIALIEAALAEPEQEPVMIYNGRHTIDCGEFGAHDMEMLKLIPAGTKLYTSPQPREWQELFPLEFNELMKDVDTVITQHPEFDKSQREWVTYLKVSATLRAKNGG